MTTLRNFFKLAVGFAAGGAIGTAPLHQAPAAEPLTFMTPFGFIPDFLEMMNMVSGGFLAREGFTPPCSGDKGRRSCVQLMSGASNRLCA